MESNATNSLIPRKIFKLLLRFVSDLVRGLLPHPAVHRLAAFSARAQLNQRGRHNDVRLRVEELVQQLAGELGEGLRHERLALGAGDALGRRRGEGNASGKEWATYYTLESSR